MKRFIFSLLAVVLGATALAGADWSSYRVYAPTPRAIQRVADSELNLLSEVVGPITDVAAPNDGLLRQLGLKFERTGSLPDPMGPYQRYTDGLDYKTEYLTLDEIMAQYEEWRAAYPSLIQREQIGTSHLGRPIWVYRLHNPNGVFPETGVFIHGAIHAREWISPPTCMYVFESMLKEALTSSAGWELITRYELSVVPVLNPDGYAHTWSTFRMWRKNRRDNGGGVYGVDLNRNYSKGWGGQGSSGDPGSDTYRGPFAFSEPEVACVRDYLNARTATVPFNFIIDYHSYGEYVLYPWSYTFNPAPDAARLHAVGTQYNNAMIASGGHSYQVGQGSTTLYIAAGTSKDFYYDQYGADAFTVELRGPGFDPPASSILPTIRENWAGFRAVLRSLL
ncbi:MAG: hypothetical protein M3R13_07585 [Armatimonadota bacterium]|nr:hypothetical protein [Armatimonadota bacterium]